MRKQLSEVTLPLWIGHLERWLERAGSTFFVGNEITIADIVIYTRMKWLRRGVRFLIGLCKSKFSSVGHLSEQTQSAYSF